MSGNSTVRVGFEQSHLSIPKVLRSLMQCSNSSSLPIQMPMISSMNLQCSSKGFGDELRLSLECADRYFGRMMVFHAMHSIGLRRLQHRMFPLQYLLFGGRRCLQIS